MGISADAAVDIKWSVERLIKEAYETGLSEGSQKAEEVWRFLDAIHQVDSPERAWDKDTDNSIGQGYVWEKFDTYAEARATFESWKKRGQWEPMAGDVVRLRLITSDPGVIVGVLTEDKKVHVWWKGIGQAYLSVEDLEPTGRHVDIAPILKVLEEAEHE